MTIPIIRFALCGSAFLLTLISGLWLSHLGKPYNVAFFNIHKLIALATVITIGINARHLFTVADQHAALATGLLVAAGLLFVALFATGALLSIGNLSPVLSLRVHQVAPLLALAASAAALILLVQAGVKMPNAPF